MLRKTLALALLASVISCGASSTTIPAVPQPKLPIRILKNAAPIPLAWRHRRLTVTAYVVNPRERGRCETYTDLTATQTVAGPKTIAVNPATFPYGTRFLVPGYGPGTALDTGGAMRADPTHIDLAMTSCAQAFAWGVRHLVVAYLPPSDRTGR